MVTLVVVVVLAVFTKMREDVITNLAGLAGYNGGADARIFIKNINQESL